MISRLVLENWRTHARSEFSFEKGTNVLVGVIGSGKTSVMDAICYALFGTFPMLSTRRLAIDEVITSKPNEMEEAKILLDFDYNAQQYRVERTVSRRGTNSAKVFQNGRLIAGPKVSDATAEIERILEMNYELFSRAVYSEQNQIDYFLRLTPSQRKEKFDELLGINRYERARGNAVTVQNRLVEMLNDRKRFCSEQKMQFDEALLKNARAKIAEGEKRISALAKESASAKSSAERLHMEIGKLEKSEQMHNKLHDAMLESGARAKSAEVRISELNSKLREHPPEKIYEDARAVEKRISELRDRRAALEGKTIAAEKGITAIAKKQSAADSKVSELKKLSLQLRDAAAQCPVCRAKLPQESKAAILGHYAEDINMLLVESKSLEAEAKNADACRAELRKQSKVAETELEDFAAKLAKLGSLRDLAKDLETQKILLSDERSKEAELSKALKALSFDSKELTERRRLFAEAKSKADSIAREINSERELQEQIMERVKSMENAKRQIDELQQGIAHLEHISAKLGVFITSLKHAQAEMRIALVDTINNAMEDIWPRLYPYGDYQGLRIDVQGGDYEIMVKGRSGSWGRVDGILSGGERSAVAITMRIAVSLMLTQNLSWLILDEPTHNLDTATVSGVSKLLKEHLPNLVEQVFLITHDKQMESAASGAVFLLERAKDEDGATKVTAEPVRD